MKLKKIKKAIDKGKKVYWSNRAYGVIKDELGQYLITCKLTDYCIKLHGLKGTEYENKLNGDEKDFFRRS